MTFSSKWSMSFWKVCKECRLLKASNFQSKVSSMVLVLSRLWDKLHVAGKMINGCANRFQVTTGVLCIMKVHKTKRLRKKSEHFVWQHHNSLCHKSSLLLIPVCISNAIDLNLERSFRKTENITKEFWVFFFYMDELTPPSWFYFLINQHI